MDMNKTARDIRKQVRTIERFTRKIRLKKPDVVDSRREAIRSTGRLLAIARDLEGGNG